jgi:hypothetical protein
MVNMAYQNKLEVKMHINKKNILVPLIAGLLVIVCSVIATNILNFGDGIGRDTSDSRTTLSAKETSELKDATITSSRSESNNASSGKSSQSDYPILSDNGAGSYIALESFQQLCVRSEFIVKAKVTKVFPMVSETFIPDAGTPFAEYLEKTGQKEYLAKSYPVEILIQEVLKGDISKENQEIFLYRSEIIYEASPTMNVNDIFVLFLDKRKTVNDYIPVRPQEGFYYYAVDNKVYPAVVTPVLQDTSGMEYVNFKSKIIDSLVNTNS